MSGSVTHYDVIIVGAGMVGAALACALGDSSLQIAVVEAKKVSTQWPQQQDTIDGFDARVSAITVASQQFLQGLGVWPMMAERRVSPYTHMHVWDADGTGSIDFDAQDVNEPVLGHIVENGVISSALMQRIYRHTNIDVVDDVKLTALQLAGENSLEDLARITLDNGRSLVAPLVVAADGAQSTVRGLAGIVMREWDYDHHAIVATVKTERAHGQTAWQRFLPEGPLAFLPLSTAKGEQQFCSLVWSAKPDYADQLMCLNDDDFAIALGDAFEGQLGRIEAVHRRLCFPLRQRHAVDYIKLGLALVGDAAHTIHPLAGQGVNLGLMDVRVLSEELLRAQHRQLQLGSLLVLQRYQRRRKAANLAMMVGMEGFKRLFEQSSLTVRWARNTGMRWLDNASLLKHRVMRRAMGL